MYADSRQETDSGTGSEAGTGSLRPAMGTEIDCKQTTRLANYTFRGGLIHINYDTDTCRFHRGKLSKFERGFCSTSEKTG